MKILGVVLASILVATALIGLQVLGRVQAQPMAPMHPPMSMQGGGMMSPQQMNAMAAQMQANMAQLNVRVKALREQLDKINPDLLTGQERPMYEYLKLLQTHLESMNAMMGSMQGMMMQIGR